MDDSRIFRSIQRLNSVLFLFLLIGATVLVGVFTYQATTWRDRRVIEVAQEGDGGAPDATELVLGRVQQVTGHNAFFVELRSKSRRGELSGYSGGEIRNVLFFVGEELRPRWLLEQNTNLILEATPIRNGRNYDSDKEVAAFFYQIITIDTNGDGSLSSDDMSEIALSMPDGSKLTKLESNVVAVLDSQLSEDGGSVLVLYQTDSDVVYSKYSISNGKKISSSTITRITKTQ